MASSDSQALDLATCEAMRTRARFFPARDDKGMPVEGRWSSRFRWVLPKGLELSKGGKMPIASWHAAAVLTISATGQVLSCVDQQPELPPNVDSPCDLYTGKLPPVVFDGLGIAGAEQKVTVELAITFDGAPEAALYYATVGQKPSALRSVIFDVSENGMIKNCRPVATGKERWLSNLASICSVATDWFVAPTTAEGKPRRPSARFTQAWSTAR